MLLIWSYYISLYLKETKNTGTQEKKEETDMIQGRRKTEKEDQESGAVFSQIQLEMLKAMKTWGGTWDRE